MTSNDLLSIATVPRRRDGQNAEITYPGVARLIDREELKERLDRGEDLRPVMTLGELAYAAAHIPGSLRVSSKEGWLDLLAETDPSAQIVVYCTNEACPIARVAYYLAEQHGYGNVWLFAGGLFDWMEAGYPVEGKWARRT
jgi:rhodanese-related sulfurtransferase